MKRALCLYFPFLTFERRANSAKQGVGVNRESATGSVEVVSTELAPAVTVQPKGSTLRVVQVNQAAGEIGIRLGHTLAHAQALVPMLQSYDENPVGDRAQLEALALWAQCLSPIVHLEGDDSLLVDVTGCERLFRGERNLLNRAWEGCARAGL